MTRVNIRWVGAAIVALAIVAVVSLVLSLASYGTRADVARREAARAAAAVETTQKQVFVADCALIDLFRARPGDPSPTTELGVLRAERVEDAYAARGCPP